VAAYSGTWAPKGSVTEVNLGLTLGLRGATGRENDFNEEFRFSADKNFITLRGDISHTHDLPKGWEAFAKVQGQLSDQPLINTEQFAGGGLGTVRGYLEAEALGDNAVFGTLELRTPSLIGWLPGKENEMRIYVFGDAGMLTIQDALPEQEDTFTLASFGVGSRVQLWKYLNGSVDFSVPVIGEGTTKAGETFLHFRVWADF
jgi:hemolysin activation/secretion protein